MMAARGSARSFRWQQSQWRSTPLESRPTAVFAYAVHANAINIIRMAGYAVSNIFARMASKMANLVALTDRIEIYSIDAASTRVISVPDPSVVIRALADYANSMLAYTMYAERLRSRRHFRYAEPRRRRLFNGAVFSIHAAAIQTPCFAYDTIPLKTKSRHSCSVREVGPSVHAICLALAPHSCSVRGIGASVHAF
jgi:hypothetical protein